MQNFDVVIIGGGVVGSSAAYFLSSQPDFNGSIAVIEKDPTYAEAATPRSAGGVRLQCSTAENVLMGAFGADFIKSADEHLRVGNEGAGVEFRENGYLFLATGAGLKTLLMARTTASPRRWRCNTPTRAFAATPSCPA